VVEAVVFTVRVDVPDPPATEVGLNVHVGCFAAAGVTVQDKLTALLNPLAGVIVIVEVAIPPFATEAGVRAVAAIVKSGTGAGVTVTWTVVLWFVELAPATVTV